MELNKRLPGGSVRSGVSAVARHRESVVIPPAAAGLTAGADSRPPDSRSFPRDVFQWARSAWVSGIVGKEDEDRRRPVLECASANGFSPWRRTGFWSMVH